MFQALPDAPRASFVWLPVNLRVAEPLDQDIRGAIRRIDLIEDILQVVRNLHRLTIVPHKRSRAEGLACSISGLPISAPDSRLLTSESVIS